MSLSKLLLTNNLQRIGDVAQELLGEAIAGDGGTAGYAWRDLLLTVPGLRIGGGINEIIRDIMAQHVLNMPR